jgi:hypothetical protein
MAHRNPSKLSCKRWWCKVSADEQEGVLDALMIVPAGYAEWLTEVKARIHAAQQRAALAVNAEVHQAIGSVRTATLDCVCSLLGALPTHLRMTGLAPRTLSRTQLFLRVAANAPPANAAHSQSRIPS